MFFIIVFLSDSRLADLASISAVCAARIDALSPLLRNLYSFICVSLCHIVSWPIHLEYNEHRRSIVHKITRPVEFFSELLLIVYAALHCSQSPPRLISNNICDFIWLFISNIFTNLSASAIPLDGNALLLSPIKFEIYVTPGPFLDVESNFNISVFVLFEMVFKNILKSYLFFSVYSSTPIPATFCGRGIYNLDVSNE